MTGSAWKRRRGVSGEGLLLFIICVLDTLSSALFFHWGLAVEANPLLRPFAEAGVLPFVLVKAGTFVPTIFLAEAYARLRPGFVRPLMGAGAAAYVLLYAWHVAAQWW